MVAEVPIITPIRKKILIIDYGFDIKGIKRISESRNSPKKLQYELVTTLYTKFILFFVSAIIGLSSIFFLPYFYNEILLFLFSLTIVFAQVFNPIWFLQGIEDFYNIDKEEDNNEDK